MPIQYRCPKCDQLLSISSRKAGFEVPCPRCRSITIVPKPDAGELDAPPELPVRAVKPEVPRPAVATLPDSPVPTIRSRDRADEELADAAVETQREPPDENLDAPPPDAIDEDLGGFQLRKANPELGELDLTSMVDVTFLLLIFFMVTASFSLQKTIEVPAPKQDQKGAAQSLTLEDLQANTIFVKIDERNGIFVDEAPAGNPEKLSEVLTQARLTTLRTEVAIDAHPDALHETVVLVIDAATAAGMQKIRIVSRSGGAE